MKYRRWLAAAPTCLLLHAAIAQKEVTLLFAGDAMQHQSQLASARRNDGYDYYSYFKHLRAEIASADIAVVNLEVTLGGSPFTGYPQFSAPDEFAFALKDAGFNVVLNANNHILDRGSRGLRRTLDVLDAIPVAHTGAFRNYYERSILNPLIVVAQDIRFAMLNYTYGTNGIVAQPPVVVNYIDREQILSDIAKARSLNADIIVANMHWGDEYRLIQNQEQDALADFMIREGVDLVIGSHPHVVQPSRAMIDLHGNISNIVVYSLGNLVSGMIAPNTYGGQIVKVVVEKSPFRQAVIKRAEYALVYRYKDSTGGMVDFSVIPVSHAERADSIPTIELNHADYNMMMRFAESARKLFGRYNIGVTEYKPRLCIGDTATYPDFSSIIFGD
ncbi:MAG: CapA family protein [Tannerellaceae bacterium]|nr:CapA family protein [Tannerellaceae bacterium]